MIDNILHKDTYNSSSFADEYYAEKFNGDGTSMGTVDEVDPQQIKFSFENTRKRYDKVKEVSFEEKFIDYKTYSFKDDQKAVVRVGDVIKPGDVIARGSFINKVFYKNIGRTMLLAMFAFIAFLVYLAYNKRRREGRATL